MGGGFFEGGNITPTAEFNIYVDPHAAQIVLQSGVPVVILPLDVTHKTLTTAKRVDRFRAMGTKAGDASVALLEFFERFDEEKYGRDGGPLHDPNVIAYVMKPELYGGRRCNVIVDATNELDARHDGCRLVGRDRSPEERASISAMWMMKNSSIF